MSVSVKCELLSVLYHSYGVAFCICICQGGVAASEVIVVKESVDQSLTHPAAEPARYLTAVVTGTRYLTAVVTGTRYLTVAVTGTNQVSDCSCD